MGKPATISSARRDKMIQCLENEKAELLRQVEECRRELSGICSDGRNMNGSNITDRSLFTEQPGLPLQVTTCTRRLQEIQDALEELKNGSKSRECRGCSEIIPLDRLKVMPEAIFCIPCQEKREKENKPKQTPQVLYH